MKKKTPNEPVMYELFALQIGGQAGEHWGIQYEAFDYRRMSSFFQFEISSDQTSLPNIRAFFTCRITVGVGA